MGLLSLLSRRVVGSIESIESKMARVSFRWEGK